MQNKNRGRTLGLCLLLVAVAMLGGALSGLFAANNSAPSGWLMANRERAKWAMGQPLMYTMTASSTSILTDAAVAVGDVVCGVCNLSDPTETNCTLSNCTPTASTITMSAGTPFTAGEKYAVLVYRPQATDR